MNKYRRFALVVLAVELLLIVLCNGLCLAQNAKKTEKLYRVEAARAARELEHSPAKEIDLADYPTLVDIRVFDPDAVCNEDYIVTSVDGTLYQILYREPQSNRTIVYMNVAFMILFLFTLLQLLYIGIKILRPFHRMTDLTCELAKGNLSTPIPEEKSHFFGKFLWGMDMLREHLEDSRERELAFQKEKKTLILSLSHDIKTPLSAIRLYTKALSEHLYPTPEKREAALCGITHNVEEMEEYLAKITRASREDFLDLPVNNGEFYLSEVIHTIEAYYRDKLEPLHTELMMDDIEDCLLHGDADRVVEVFQNLMENAIKYGDGKCICISCSEEENCRLILVENTGTTPKPEELPNLFDAFSRGSNAGNQKGSGLGLYICRNLLLKMDGDIFARITPDGHFGVTVVLNKI